ncbi:hypothetical protein [Thalassotalea ganghwensis]
MKHSVTNIVKSIRHGAYCVGILTLVVVSPLSYANSLTNIEQMIENYSNKSRANKPKAPKLLLCVLKGKANKLVHKRVVYIECDHVVYDRNKDKVVGDLKNQVLYS